MAFSAITTAQIQVGEPTKKEIFQKTKDNFDDHETRILDLESSSSATFPMSFVISDSGVVDDEVAYIRVPFNITVTSVILTVVEAGTAGTLEIDVLSNQGGSFSTILPSTLTRAYTAGDFSSTTSASIVTDDIDSGKILRLDIDAVQTEMRDAFVTINYTVRS